MKTGIFDYCLYSFGHSNTILQGRRVRGGKGGMYPPPPDNFGYSSPFNMVTHLIEDLQWRIGV